jgi:glutaredoxin
MGEFSATKRRSIFRKRGLAFQERDLAQDPGALGDLKKLGNITTPVIVIDGAVIVGFDSAKIDGYT